MGVHVTLSITTLCVNIDIKYKLLFCKQNINRIYGIWDIYIKSRLYMDNMHRLVTVDFAW